MKKILLLFVLFLGLNVGAFAAFEVEPVLVSSEMPDRAILYFNDGTSVEFDDGFDCLTVYGESTGGGILDPVWTNCK